MKRPRVTLEQWRSALAVADHGSFAAGANALHKSQSSISHAVAQLSQQLDVPVFRSEGRRAVLSEEGRLLLERARRLLADAGALEDAAAAMARGWEAEILLAADTIFPADILMRALNRFAAAAPDTRVDVMETVLSGTLEALTSGAAELAISGLLPPQMRAEPLFDMEFLAVAHRDHPLNAGDGPVDFDDLRPHRQLVVRDSGPARYDAGWLEAEQRWTFSSLTSSVDAIRHGSGFAWIPRAKIVDELESGLIKPLGLREGSVRRATIHLIFRDWQNTGPATRALADAIFAEVAALDSECARAGIWPQRPMETGKT